MTTPDPVTERIEALTDWRGDTLRRVRGLIREALPGVQESVKWAKATSPGVPVWEHAGIVCTGESYARAVKLTFPRGASLPDPAGLFNASLDGNARRAIDLTEGATLDEAAFRDLIRAAAAANEQAQAARKKPRRT
ncbi:hypothetical protein DEIGR_100405 [Deinococcus grandis]|uniref:YdhG-like domain-containing protein n=1 Tax=Deinococcus grandis TaxID=57498 RepID=A0A100HGX9_9DEIO|nr:DUF1801 domain-containing protein [Deinococcus grandis]BBN96140.1 hypothetical protein DEGR_28730 [Deinococcus grandis]GAQ20378.1 hypothetical protein DEIGR_100405 [Deinococcus grandis]